MMKPEEMTKLKLIGPKTYRKRVIETLYNLNLYHITDHKKTEDLDIGQPAEHSDMLAEAIVKIRSLKSNLGLKSAKQKLAVHGSINFSKICSKISSLHENVSDLIKEKKEAEELIIKNNESIKTLELFKVMKLDVSDMTASESVKGFFGFIPKKNKLVENIKNITNNYSLSNKVVDDKNLIALFVENDNYPNVSDLLNKIGFSEVDSGSLNEVSGSSIVILKRLKEQNKKLQKKVSSTNSRIVALSKENRSFLLENEYTISEELKRAQLPLSFAETGKAFMIEGWIPKKNTERAFKSLNDVTSGKIYIESSEPKNEKDIPIKLKNPKLVQPFEFFMGLYSLPSYKEIDPTFLMFLTFPIFFGLMLGDVGYGIVTLILFLYLKKKIPSGKALLKIMIFASIVTIVFGFAFGEYFGFEHLSEEKGEALCHSTGICFAKVELHHGGGDHAEAEMNLADVEEETHETVYSGEAEGETNGGVMVVGNGADHETEELHEPIVAEHAEAAHAPTEYIYDFPRVLNRAHGKMNVFGFEILSILVIGAIIGFIHLNFALFIGFLNAFMAHGFLEAFYEKISWMIMEAGVIMIAMSFIGYNIPVYIGALIFVGSIGLIYKGEGVQGLVELPAIFSNMLSYMRLGAVGLASVGLAVVVNENLAMPLINKGGFAIIGGILVMILGHTVNIGLGIIGPFLHSLRLHYVEFFSKFYKGGGIEYDPFGYTKT